MDAEIVECADAPQVAHEEAGTTRDAGPQKFRMSHKYVPSVRSFTRVRTGCLSGLCWRIHISMLETLVQAGVDMYDKPPDALANVWVPRDRGPMAAFKRLISESGRGRSQMRRDEMEPKSSELVAVADLPR